MITFYMKHYYDSCIKVKYTSRLCNVKQQKNAFEHEFSS